MTDKTILHYKILEKLGEGGLPREIIQLRSVDQFRYVNIRLFGEHGWSIYLTGQPYPAFDKRWLISNEGGNEPTWRGDGKELFYRNGYKMMAVTIQVNPEFHAGTPRVLFEAEYDLHRFDDQNYDVTRDGQHFLMVQSEKATEAPQIHVVVNWFEELQRKMQEANR